MVNIDDAYPGGNLYKASDIKNPFTAKITDAKTQTMKEGASKIVLSLEGHEMRLTSNKTNSTRIAKAYGKETNDWIGKEIRASVEDVLFKGKLVPGIRLEPVPDDNSRTA